MVEKILEKVINAMVPHLEEGQLEHLKNVLYVNFHGKELCDELKISPAWIYGIITG